MLVFLAIVRKEVLLRERLEGFFVAVVLFFVIHDKIAVQIKAEILVRFRRFYRGIRLFQFERPAPRPAAPQAQNPFAAPVAQQMIASKRDKESDIDIDELENRPAFVRRNVKFVKDNSAEGGRSSRVALKDDSAPSDKTQNSSLFD